MSVESPSEKQSVPKSESKESKPIPVKNGAISLKVYRYKDRFAFVHGKTASGRPKTHSFKTEAAAVAAAEERCIDIGRGNLAAGTLTPEQRGQAVAARELLAPLGMGLDTSAREIVEAHKLTGGAGILEMARFWARHHQAASGGRPPGAVLKEMLAAKVSEGLDNEYLRNVREPMQKFAAAFPGPIGEISAAEIREYLAKLPVVPLTRNNLRGSIVMLFRFAQTAGDLPEDRRTEAEKVGRWKVKRKVPVVYTPPQLARWLGIVRDSWLPWMALGAFAGIRSDEIAAMDWSDILWLTKEIFIRPEIAKTGKGRYVPLQDNLAAWLLPHRHGSGPIVPDKGRVNLETHRMTLLMRKSDGPAWDRNALRHSYASHRLGVIRDLGKLTVEMGNSIQVNQHNYQNPRGRQECVEYFNLYPAAKGRVIPMNGGQQEAAS